MFQSENPCCVSKTSSEILVLGACAFIEKILKLVYIYTIASTIPSQKIYIYICLLHSSKGPSPDIAFFLSILDYFDYLDDKLFFQVMISLQDLRFIAFSV